MTGVRLLLTEPLVAHRDCGHCQKYCYDEDKGQPIERPPRGSGLCILRPPGNVPPCRTVGCPKGTPENQLSLTPQNMQAYRHYQRCKAVGRVPEDEIVEFNAGLILEVEDSIERLTWSQFRVSVLQAVTAMRGIV